eukprot:NODE_7077_length_1611_cov_12.595687.p1 GENE.NODE_7077_length_1611_cov_12.595687~~NODE_7077_length_1611_cov_12.595687.p1  ORF type:complete len:435 (+),score=101.62 NODE_7077_length_1611_cov_12.595687:7-1311(+)
MPLWFELLIEDGLYVATRRVLGQTFRLSPVFFAFQSKTIDHHFIHEIMYGGAVYLPTGRGLATERISFVELFSSFAPSNIYTGAEITSLAIVACIASEGIAWTLGWVVCVVTIVTSWCLGPFIFNPYQFQSRVVMQEMRDFRKWLRTPGGDSKTSWLHWCSETNAHVFGGRIWLTWLPSASLMMTFCVCIVLALKMRAQFILLELAGEGIPSYIRETIWFIVFAPPILPQVLFTLMGVFSACQRRPSDRGPGSQEVASPISSLILLLAVISEVLICAWLGHMWTWPNFVLGSLVAKYLWIRTLVSFCDSAFPPALWLFSTRSALPFWQRVSASSAVAMVLGFRWLRDFVLGYALLFTLLVLSSGSNQLHTIFLMRIKPHAAPGESEMEEVRSQAAGGGSGSSATPSCRDTAATAPATEHAQMRAADGGTRPLLE